MEKIILAVANFEKEKYYLEESFSALPETIKEEVRIFCITLAHKLMCTFIIGFHPEGEIYFETVKSETLLDFDDIGAELEIKKAQKEKNELLRALGLWFLVYKTKDGMKMREELLRTVNSVEISE